jgi:signal transduction histidine kinase
LGGQFSLDSTQGSGTTLRVSVPAPKRLIGD